MFSYGELPNAPQLKHWRKLYCQGLGYGARARGTLCVQRYLGYHTLGFRFQELGLYVFVLRVYPKHRIPWIVGLEQRLRLFHELLGVARFVTGLFIDGPFFRERTCSRAPGSIPN